MISSVGIERAQYIEVSKVNHNGNTLDILPSSKNYFARTLCVNQRSIDLRVGRFDCVSDGLGGKRHADRLPLLCSYGKSRFPPSRD